VWDARRWIIRASALALTCLGAYSLLVILAQQVDDRFANRYTEQFERIFEEVGQDALVLRVWVRDVNTDDKLLDATLHPLFKGEEYGTNNLSGWVPKSPVRLLIDSAIPVDEDDGDNDILFAPTYQGTVPITVDLSFLYPSSRSSTFYFPFDEYRFQVPVVATYQSEGEETDTEADDVYLELPVVHVDYGGSAADFDVSMRPLTAGGSELVDDDVTVAVQEAVAGYGNVLLDVRRSLPSQLLTLIVVVLMIASAGLVLAMGVLIASNHRPPTIQALVWAAALTFALVQIRELLPGKPPTGILLDYFVYYPALLVSLGCSVWILIMWARKEHFVAG
jgi:hypothetical protein